MDPELGELKSSSAGTGFKAPGQQCLSNWEMERTTVDGCSLVDENSNFGENIFFLEELAIGTQTDNQTASSKAVCQKISCKPEDKELISDENKQFDPGGKGGEPTLLRAGVLVFFDFFWGMHGLGCPICFSCFVCLFWFVFRCRKN